MEDIKLTASEWNILNCLWEQNPRTVMQIASELEKTVGWARSTTITTLHRMEAKGLVRCEQAGRGKAYVPLVERERAYIAAWDDMGFDNGAIRMAYERTVVKKVLLLYRAQDI